MQEAREETEEEGGDSFVEFLPKFVRVAFEPFGTFLFTSSWTTVPSGPAAKAIAMEVSWRVAPSSRTLSPGFISIEAARVISVVEAQVIQGVGRVRSARRRRFGSGVGSEVGTKGSTTLMENNHHSTAIIIIGIFRTGTNQLRFGPLANRTRGIVLVINYRYKLMILFE